MAPNTVIYVRKYYTQTLYESAPQNVVIYENELKRFPPEFGRPAYYNNLMANEMSNHKPVM